MQTNYNYNFDNNLLSFLSGLQLPSLPKSLSQGDRMAGIIENVPTGSQTDNNYNSIVNYYIGSPVPTTERLIFR